MFNKLESPEFKVEEAYDEFLNRIENAGVNKKDKNELQNFIKTLKEDGEIKEELNLSIEKLWENIKKYCSTTLDRLPVEKTCPICGLYVENSNTVFYLKNNNKWSIEHIKPKSSYLDYICTPTNLVKICKDCNENKGDWDEDVSIIFNPYTHEYPNLLYNIHIEYYRKDKHRFHYEFKLSNKNDRQINDDHSRNYEDIYKVGSTFKEYTEKFISDHFINSLEQLADEIDSLEGLTVLLESDIRNKIDKIDSDTVEGKLLTELLTLILNNISEFITLRKEFDFFS